MTNQAAAAVTRFLVVVVLLTVSWNVRAESVSPHILHLKSGIIDTGSKTDALAMVSRRDAEFGRLVLQLDGPIDPDRRARLVASGVVLTDYLPSNAYITNVDEAQAQALAGLAFVRWVGRFQDDWKLDPRLGQRRFKTDARIELAERGLLQVVVVLFASEDIGLAINDLVTAGATVMAYNRVGDQWMIDAVVPAASVAQLARIESVKFVEDAPEGTMRNDTNAWILQSNSEDYTPIWDAGIHGEEQIGGMIDGTIYTEHCAFWDETDPIGPDHRKIVAMRDATAWPYVHGTHTAGTFAGDDEPYGVYDQYDGIAFAARISFSYWGPVWEFPSTLYDRLVDAHYDGARVHSNSWGDDGTTEYTTWCHQIDKFSYDFEESLVAFAVTNDPLLKTPENAKNVLAVGASLDTPNQYNHYDGGSGPTADGRRKPEIYAPGFVTMSANANTECDVRTLSGTSMACPAVCGAGLLIRQYFTDGYYPTGLPVDDDAITPSGALIKAVLINSAVDMTGVTGYPSDREGWGRLLLDDSLYFPGDVAKMLVQDVRNANGLSTGDETWFQIAVVSSDAPLRITLVFTEPPASVLAADPVINNLDLEVTAPGGTIYVGNQIVDGQSIPDGSFDPKNNVERVIALSPAVGTYTIAVKGTAVNVGTQGYALVVTGDGVFDCNDNGVPDDVDIASGTSEDCDANGVPDDCQQDLDGDGTINECDEDIDGDGVLNDGDVCDFTIPGTPVDTEGRPISDTQGDCDVDLGEYGEFETCLAASGPGIPALPDPCGEAFNYDGDQGDQDVDLADFRGFQNAFTGSP